MPEMEVVAKIEDLVQNTEPALATQIMAYVKAAQNYRVKAQKVYEILISGLLVKPKMSSRKTIAVSEDTATVSGWDSLNPKWKPVIAEQESLLLEQNQTKVKQYYEIYKKEFEKYGYKTRVWELDPHDDLGKHYRSHAEKQISVIKPSYSIGVSRPMCIEDCYPYLRALVQIRKQNIVIADSDGIWVFYGNSQVKFADV